MSGRRFFLLPISGESSGELERNTAGVLTWSRESDPWDAVDRLWSATPAAPAYRRVVLADSLAHAQGALADLDPRWVHTMEPERAARQVAFCFSGLGETVTVHGRALYRCVTEFRTTLDRLEGLAKDRLGHDLGVDRLRHNGPKAAQSGGEPCGSGVLRSAMRPARAAVAAGTRATVPTQTDQPLRWAVGYALARTWLAAGIAPSLVLGHSLGEYVVACLAGVFSEEDALRLVVRRAELIAELPAGSMVVISLPAEVLAPRLPDGVVVSAVNAPSLTVVSGSGPALDGLVQELAAEGTPHRRLDVDRPFHSPQLAPVEASLAEMVADADRRPPRLRWISSVTGRWMRPADAVDPGYWARHTSAPVNYLAALRLARRAGPLVLLEVGAGESLTTFAAHTLLGVPAPKPVPLASLPRSPYWDCDSASWLSALGRLWTLGASVDWAAAHALIKSPETATA
ncbi:acyltransferase domain-containing protein [Streptomyces sioyaensis]|uniref:acyltransferase domain-containing protein n=1 Tax=Streptomyces sioyaensis TaxID=67364 RepID=UPI0037A4D585